MAVLNLPINSVSFGQVSIGLLREAYSRGGEDHFVLPLNAQVDLESQPPDKDFEEWILRKAEALSKSKGYSRDDTSVKLWHLNPDSLSFPTNKRHLISFYELDSPTNMELNVVKNCDKVFFTSEYSCEVFRSKGCDNVEYLPLFFDSYNFKQTNKTYYEDDRITFNLVGKLEKRKHHIKMIRAWVKKFGNNKKFFLNCSVYNHFLSQEENNNGIAQALDNEKPFNTNFLPWMKENSVYNDFLNSSDITLAMSGGEGWGLPEFHSVAMGSHAVVLNCNGYKSWANEKNSVLVEPEGKLPAHDGRFFLDGANVNQGNIFDWNEDKFIAACEEAVKRVEKNKLNEEGLKLQEDFKVSTTFDKIL
jgi:glycosyltransferase involved in cell wall biosynthesis